MSCLFDSLASFIHNTNGKILRDNIISYMKKDPVLITPDLKLSSIIKNEENKEDDNIQLQKYISHMSKEDTWGGAIEIRCFCQLYKTKVNVVTDDNNSITFLPINNESKYEINISWINNHYEPIFDNK